MGIIYFISHVAYGMNPVFTVVDTFIFPIQHLRLGRNVALMATFLLPVATLMKNWWWDMYWMNYPHMWEMSFHPVLHFCRTRYLASNQSSINGFFTKKQPHPVAIVSLLKWNKRLRKPDWGTPLPVRGNVPEAAQLACYWLSNQTQHPVGPIPKGKSTSWVFQSPHCGLAVLTHGNQKDPCLSKLHKVEFAIIY